MGGEGQGGLTELVNSQGSSMGLQVLSLELWLSRQSDVLSAQQCALQLAVVWERECLQGS